MKKISSVILLAAISLAVSACKKDESYTVKTTLNIPVELIVKTEDKKVVSLNAGEFPMSLTLTATAARATVTTAEKKSVVFNLNLPSGTTLIDEGTISIPATKSGQNFDVAVDVSTEVRKGNSQSAWQSCHVDRWENVCRIEGNPPTYVCRPELRPGTGQQQVVFYMKDYVRSFAGRISAVESADQILATFEGTRTDSVKVVTRTGPCM